MVTDLSTRKNFSLGFFDPSKVLAKKSRQTVSTIPTMIRQALELSKQHFFSSRAFRQLAVFSNT